MNEQVVLQQALSHYGLANAHTVLLQALWNHVYRIETASGERFTLRVCSPTYRDLSSLQDELSWLVYVADHAQGVVPRPVENLRGDVLTVLEMKEGRRFCCLFEWIEGEDARNCLTPGVMHQIGRLVATLHEIAKGYAFPDASNHFRHTYCFHRPLILAHREWIAEHEGEIGPENLALLHRAIDWLLEVFEQIGETRENFGFIHADLHLGNFLVQEGKVSVIDFDQVGRGHYLYDIACLMVDLFEQPEELALRWRNFKSGYATVAELPFRHEAELEPFVVAVHLAFLDWVYNTQELNVQKTKMPLVPGIYASIRQRVPAAL